MPGITHAAIVPTRWGQGLAFLNQTSEDIDCLTLQLWGPLGEGGELAKVSMNIALPAEASDRAHEIMWEANREAVANMTGERFEKAFETAGIAAMLDQAFAKDMGEAFNV